MNRYKSIFLFFISLIITQVVAQNKYNDYVNPFIGTGGHGHTFPGAVVPFGMVQLSPDTRADASWDGSSGYHYSDTSIYGFSHTHLSGTGVSDWGDVLVMPTVGTPSFDKKIYASKFSHANEKASPGSYEVTLDDDNIKAELTVTPRVGIHRYTFPKTKEANIIIDLLHRDKLINSDIRMTDSTTIVGLRESQGWARNQYVFFEIKFSKPFKTMSLSQASKKDIAESNPQYKRMTKEEIDATTADGMRRRHGSALLFDMSDGKPLLIKVAISSCGIEGARANLKAEAPHWDFEKYKSDAANAWNKQLQKIEVEENDKDKLSTFYTALYHCFIHPSLNMDVDSLYRGRDNQIHKAQDFTNYTVFSLWDTYRALHPLYTILERKRTVDFIKSFYHQYELSGRLPVWELSSNETDCMIGFHAVSVISDALVKGIAVPDTMGLYKAMKAASNYTGFGIPDFNKKGYLQIDDEKESVSKSLEYAYDNWCISQIAKMLNQKEDEREFRKRSQAYKNLFDATTGLIRPRKNGGWLNPFLPADANNNYTEGNSWQYSFYVPHDVEGLIKLHGGSENFEKKLDELFTTDQKLTGISQADITGLIGQYAHGNEPSHHMSYLYNYVGKPQKTIERVHQICANFYKNLPDGLIGNEDCGQMSAWYIFSSLGFYPVCPGSTDYVLSEPLFKNAKLNLEHGKQFSIAATPDAKGPLRFVELNNIKQNRSFIKHDAIMSGSTLKFFKAGAGEKDILYGVERTNWPPSKVGYNEYLASPIINSTKQIFKDKVEVSVDMINVQPLVSVYTIDGSEPNSFSPVYRSSFSIDSTRTVKAKVFSNWGTSITTEANFYKLKFDYDIQIKSKAHQQYEAEGPQTLYDGIKGNLYWKKGHWLGYQSQDFECVVDFKTQKEFSYVSMEFLQDTRSWIIFPAEANFYGSNDGKTFVLLANIKSTFNEKDYNVRAEDFAKQLKQKVKYRYLKATAKNYGKLPSWHEGAGDNAFIFVDELEIK